MDCLKLKEVISKSLSACKNALQMLVLIAFPFFTLFYHVRIK